MTGTEKVSSLQQRLGSFVKLTVAEIHHPLVLQDWVTPILSFPLLKSIKKRKKYHNHCKSSELRCEEGCTISSSLFL